MTELAFVDRLAIGDRHEKRVRDELKMRGWTADPWGQGLLGEPTREALGRTESLLRFEPDLIASRNGVVAMIDAKASTRPESGRRWLSRRALHAGLAFSGLRGIAFYFVFHDLCVAAPHALLNFTEERAYFPVPDHLCADFDAVFGSRRGAAWRAA